MLLRYLIPGFLLPAGLSLLIAQEPGIPSVSVNVLSNRVAAGEIGQFIIKLSNGDADMPQQLSAPGLIIEKSGSQSAINIINGVKSMETTYFYRFRGDAPGTYTIPEFEVVINGKPFKTRTIEITVVERDQTQVELDATKPYFAKLEVSKDEFYVNEIVPFTLTTYVRGRNSISDVTAPKLTHESFVFKGFREVRTDGADVGNTFYSSAVIPSTFFALKPGDHRLGPAEIVVRVLDSGSGFGGLSSFFQRTVPREMVTNTANVKVKPLPAGAPASFTGGIGIFEIAVKASTTAVGIGDPISMDFEVTGIGNLRTMSAPMFEIPQTGIWRSYEANKELSDENDSDGFNIGRVQFSQVIIPEAKTKAIPTFVLTYFDPVKSEYVTLRTDPIPLTVTSDPSSTSPVATRAPGSGDAAPAGPLVPAIKPTPAYHDVMHIHVGPAHWVAAAGGVQPGLVFYFVQTILSILFFTVTGFGAVRWVRAARLKRGNEAATVPFSRQLRQLPSTGSPRREYFRAVSVALSQWSTEHPDAPGEVSRVIERISDRCASVLYSGMTEPDTPVSESEVAEFTGLLNKLLRQQSRR